MSSEAAQSPPSIGDAVAPPAGGTAPIAGDYEAPTQELVSMLKAQLAAKDSDIANLRVKAEIVDQQKREYIDGQRESVQGFLKEKLEEASSTDKPYLASLCRWSDSLNSIPSEKLEDNMPLAVLVANCSASDKKRRLDDGAAAEKDEALRQMAADKEAANEKAEKFQKMWSEMQQLAEERQKAAEELSQKLARVTGVATRYAYSMPSSREVPSSTNSATGGDVPPANGKEPMRTGGVVENAASNGLVTTVDVASNRVTTALPPNPINALSSFIHSTGRGDLKHYRNKAHEAFISQAGSSTDAVSRTGGSSSAEQADIAAVVRAANNF